MPDELTEEPICHCCGYAAPLTEYKNSMGRYLGIPESYMLCKVCAATFLSHSVTYPQLYGQDHNLFSSVGWIANRLLEEIGSLRTEVRELKACLRMKGLE